MPPENILRFGIKIFTYLGIEKPAGYSLPDVGVSKHQMRGDIAQTIFHLLLC
jgi:hypothetical protein